jgi:hypothetical protein
MGINPKEDNMPQKDTFLCRYVPADPAVVTTGAGKRSEIEISLSYDEGGHSVWTGERHKRGLKLRIWPVERDDMSTTRTLFDNNGMGFLFHEMARRNPRVGQRAATEVEKHLDAIAEAARKQDWPAIKQIVQEASACLT